jgi:hypothetical protein
MKNNFFTILVPYLLPRSGIHGNKVGFALSKSVTLSRLTLLCISIYMKLPKMNKNASLVIHPLKSSTHQPESPTCGKVGHELLQCTTGLLDSGSYSVNLNFVDPNEIFAIQNCSHNCKFNIQHKLHFHDNSK